MAERYELSLSSMCQSIHCSHRSTGRQYYFRAGAGGGYHWRRHNRLPADARGFPCKPAHPIRLGIWRETDWQSKNELVRSSGCWYYLWYWGVWQSRSQRTWLVHGRGCRLAETTWGTLRDLRAWAFQHVVMIMDTFFWPCGAECMLLGLNRLESEAWDASFPIPTVEKTARNGHVSTKHYSTQQQLFRYTIS